MSRKQGTRPFAPFKSKFEVRREEIHRQEQLLLEKKRQVEAKLCSNEAAADPSTASSASEAAPSDSPSPRVTNTENFANKFQNNGSFLEMFRAMQKNSDQNRKVPHDHDENDGNEADPVPIVEPSTSGSDNNRNAKLEAIEQCAAFVAMNGLESEVVLRERFVSTSNYEWLFDPVGVDYKYFMHRVRELTSAKAETETGDEQGKESGSVKKRKRSRWGSESDVLPLDADLMQYAVQVYGTVELEERQWRQLQDQRSMRMLTGMAQKRIKQANEVKYEYDSDEDVDGGTWEHKRRMEEMERTKEQAHSVTTVNEGKSHIGDFLPPDQLSRFLRQWERIRAGKAPGTLTDDYEQFKLTSSNTGFQMMERMGWKEGQSLGTGSQPAITEPITLESTSEHRGLGTAAPVQLREGDDEFDAYRKRMMFAYRFRPNPLNNPRRNYY